MSDSESDSEYSQHSDDYESEEQGRKGTQPCKVTNGEFLCQRCGMKFPTRSKAYYHARKCKITVKKKQMLNKCMWCGLEFSNRGNLASHAFHIHGDSSYKAVSNVKQQLYTCQVCNESYKTSTLLRYHVRKLHFNLQAKVPYAEFKKVNQIWFEKVQNSNKIMEIRKTGQNTLIMRTLDENTKIKVNEVNTKFIDLSDIYPTVDSRVTCDVCGRSCLKRDFKKHYEEKHLNKKKHACNNCNRTFKRSYLYLQHNCSTMRRVKGVTHSKGQSADIRISSVESLSIPFA